MITEKSARVLHMPESTSLLHLVLESGCDVNTRNERMETPLMVCLSQLENPEKRKSILRTLLYFGANINARNGRGQTPLMYSCILDQIETVVILLNQKDIDVNIQDREGNTALMYACSLGNAMTVKILLNVHISGQHRFDLAAKDNEGLTCLQKAIEGRYASVITLLSRAQKHEMKNHYYSAEGNLRNAKSDITNKNAPKSGRRNTQPRPKSGFQGHHSQVKDPASNDSLKVFVSSSSRLHNSQDSGLSLTEESSGRLSSMTARTSSRTPRSPRPPSVDTHLEREHTFISEDYEREGGEKVEDLVLAVRQCAADIRQICHDYDINYTKGEDKSSGKGTKKKITTEDQHKTKPSGSVNSNETRHHVEGIVTRKTRKSQQTKRLDEEENLAELVNRHDAHPPHMKLMGNKSKHGFPVSDEVYDRSKQPVSVVITSPQGKRAPDSKMRTWHETESANVENNKKVYVPKFVLESRSRVNIDDKSVRDESRTKNSKPKLSVQQLLQIPINNSSGSGVASNNFPRGKPIRTKKQSDGRKQNSISSDVRLSMEPRNDDMEDDFRSSSMENWSSPFPRTRPFSADSSSSENDLNLPPLRERLRMNLTDKPLKLKGLDNDLWRIVESSGHKGQQATKR